MPIRAAVLSVVLVPAVSLGQAWEPFAALPTGGAPRTGAAAVRDGLTLYIIGGRPFTQGGDQDACAHRLRDGAWTEVAPLGGEGPIVANGAAVDALGRVVFYAGFLDNGDGEPGPARVYDPIEGAGTSLPDRPAPRSAVGYSAFAADGQGRLYAMGGGFGLGHVNSGYADRFDAAAGTWQVLPPMPTPAADACGAHDGRGRVLVFGGINQAGTQPIANVACFDTASSTWSDTAVPDMPVAVSGARAALGIDGRIYVAGGQDASGGALRTVYKLDLDANAWSVVAPMATPRRRFGLVLGSDDFLYAIGGENDAGGTSSVERLFTPRCPLLTSQPQSMLGWRGTVAGFSVTVTGAGPMQFLWRRHGTPLQDGPAPGGGTIVGSATASLTIRGPQAADEGDYDVVVSNACGEATSLPATLTTRPSPAISGAWGVRSIHDARASLGSLASSIDGGRIGGSGTWPTTLTDGRVFNLSHPLVWDAATLAAEDVSPAGSAGGAIHDLRGDLMAGWFWHMYDCWGGGRWWQCGWQSAAYWTMHDGALHEVHLSGAEFDAVYATDGATLAGTCTFEYSEGSYTSHAYLWIPGGAVRQLTPAGASTSSAGAVDGEHQYGSTRLDVWSPSHAAMWSGTPASHVDLHPAGASSSAVADASDGQVVGSASFGEPHAALWSAGGGSFLDLNPPGASSSSLHAVRSGLQLGSSSRGNGVWAGTPESFFNLGAVLPPGYSGGVPLDLEVREDGTVLVVGYAHATGPGRNEAMLWWSLPECAADFNDDGFLDFFDYDDFVACFETGACPPGRTADFNNDGFADFFDYDAFVEAFQTGC